MQVDGPKFIDSWVKNKAHYGVLNLKQMVNIFLFPALEVGGVVTPWVAKMRALPSQGWEPLAKGFAKTANKTIPWKKLKLEKWLRTTCPCHLMWILIW